MKRILLVNPEGVLEAELAGFSRRQAARAVVFDGEGHVALLWVGKHGYYKLPGGGVEAGEDLRKALARECLEEIGCAVEVLGEVGMVEEYLKMFGVHQTSYCFRADVVGEKGVPEFTEEERADDFAVVWVPLEEARRLMVECRTDNPWGRDYIVVRDGALLGAV